MPKHEYFVYVRLTGRYETTVEADSEDEAVAMAKDAAMEADFGELHDVEVHNGCVVEVS